jgi:SSS family solute:Na+ symporter
MGFVFIICSVGMYIISMLENAKSLRPNGLIVEASMFKTSLAFMAGALIATGLLVAIYSMFW